MRAYQFNLKLNRTFGKWANYGKRQRRREAGLNEKFRQNNEGNPSLSGQ